MTQKSKQISRVSLIAILLTLPLLFLYQNCGEISVSKLESGSINTGFSKPLKFTKIEIGKSHSCGILFDSGEVMCWGKNDFGQLGNGETRDSATPVFVKNQSNQNLSDVVRVDLGESHSCALIQGGSVMCWGKNNVGQLGNGSTTSSLVPTPVVDGLSGSFLSLVTDISVGNEHSCALLSLGTVKCWGSNISGKLGNDSIPTSGVSAFSSIPVFVLEVTAGSPLRSIEQLSLGWNHSCVVLTDESAKCWGANDNGQLGNETILTSFSLSPVYVFSGGILQDVKRISLGNTHSCVVLGTGGVLCWGANGNGQLGNNTTINSRTPVSALLSVGVALDGVEQISLGQNHSCALLANSEVLCWGSNEAGSLGNGTVANSLTAVSVLETQGGVALENVKQISLGPYHSCALLTNSEVLCWGYNDRGQLGNGELTNSTSPISLSSLHNLNITQPTFGFDYTCVLLSNKKVKCWGFNTSKRLGNNSTTHSMNPVQVLDDASGDGLESVAQISNTCTLITDGSVKCWGNNLQGAKSVTGLITPPTIVARQISSGVMNSCALLSDGSVGCWNATLASSPVVGLITPTERATQVSLGSFHYCSLLSDGSVKCWGQNDNGQLGNTSIPTTGIGSIITTPVFVEQTSGSKLMSVTQLSLGEKHSCALLTNKTVKCWGLNTDGQLGNNTIPVNSLAPVEVIDDTTGTALTGVVQIESGLNHSCARLSSGEIKCWGNNRFGQLGVKGIAASNTARTSLLSYQGSLVCGGYASAVVQGGQVKQVGRINPFVNIPVTLLELF